MEYHVEIVRRALFRLSPDCFVDCSIAARDDNFRTAIARSFAATRVASPGPQSTCDRLRYRAIPYFRPVPELDALRGVTTNLD